MKILSFLFFALFLFSCNQKKDAAGLNKASAPVEQGLTGEGWGYDQYDSLFHTYTIIANH